MNFTNVREEVRFTTEYGDGIIIANETLTNKIAADLSLADNIVYNVTEEREFEFIVNYKDPSLGNEIRIDGYTCFDDSCQYYEIEE